ncbi:DUF1549 domain-containing protein [uncultured Gimesia sp.]|uniref:DUF1549 domain-containing protein n=1 Tax=uncultured Gimesia sp. TaxID=1678688 RepID=UPI002633CED0|nr:DUF1549 domain-containing protein [uncultured Gimesia sp.]
MNHFCPRNLLAFLAIVTLGFDVPCIAVELRISPPSILLDSPEASQQVLVTKASSKNLSNDLSRVVRYEVIPPGIASVDESGLLRPRSDGTGKLVVHYQGQRTSIPVEVRSLKSPRPVSFRNEIIPILTKARCNSGGCHGKAEGQNGFKLSIFGFDPISDHQSLVMESHGRRVSITNPENSILFRKGSARTPHGGGQKINPGSYRDQRLLRWIAEGAQFELEDEKSDRIVRIEIEPKDQTLLAGQTQQLRVTAINASGKQQCVTTESEYESNAGPIAEVNSSGLIQASDIPGEAAILVRYLGHVTVCRITLPQPKVQFERPPENNFIDRLVWDKLERLGIEPSELTDDASFLRRVFLDTIGTLPTTAEARLFINDNATDKREKIINHLLNRDEYVDYSTMRWLDILRADQLKISPQGTVAMQRWLQKHFIENRPFDQFARELLTVQGNTSAEGPGSFYKILNKPDIAARSISQLLLGVRIECAQCHHHPSERWSQADYVGLAGFFTGLRLKKLPNGEQALVSLGGKDLPHPRSGELVSARALGSEAARFTNVADRRRVLADWMTSDENPFFSKAITNRLWSHYFGRGLVEPIDDMRATNPATNEPLMQALADHLRKLRYDIKAFTRTLLNSRVYQLSSATKESNKSDIQNFSHATYKTLPAEVLLDAICQSTGVVEKYNGWPKGYRAIQIWDNRMPSYFFRIFGRPVRASVCECERSNQPSISQAMHLMNSPEIAAKISHRHGTVQRLALSLSPSEIIDELYLGTLSRFPIEKEKILMLQAFEELKDNRRSASEDVLWALMNSKEFVFNH